MAQALRFDEHIKTAEALAQEITGVKIPANYIWLTTVTVDNAVEELEELACPLAPEGPDPQDLAIADLLEEEFIDEDEDHSTGARAMQPMQNRPQDSEPPAEDQQPGDSAHASMVIDIEDTRSLQDMPSNTEDDDSDIEFVGDMTKTVAPQVNVDEIRICWMDQVVSRLVQIVNVTNESVRNLLFAGTTNYSRPLNGSV